MGRSPAPLAGEGRGEGSTRTSQPLRVNLAEVKFSCARQSLADLDCASSLPVERPILTPLPGPPPAQVGLARLAKIDADLGQARDQWGRGTDRPPSRLVGHRKAA